MSKTQQLTYFIEPTRLNVPTFLTSEESIFSYAVPLQLSGFVYVYNPNTSGLSPKHTIYAFTIYSQNCAKLFL